MPVFLGRPTLELFTGGTPHIQGVGYAAQRGCGEGAIEADRHVPAVLQGLGAVFGWTMSHVAGDEARAILHYQAGGSYGISAIDLMRQSLLEDLAGGAA